MDYLQALIQQSLSAIDLDEIQQDAQIYKPKNWSRFVLEGQYRKLNLEPKIR